MSFILEALKKSEKKHDESAVPNLHTVHGSAPPPRRKRPVWPYLLATALLLNAGILLWFLVPRSEPPAAPAQTVAAEPIQEAPAAAVTPVKEPPMPAPVSPPTQAAQPANTVPVVSSVKTVPAVSSVEPPVVTIRVETTASPSQPVATQASVDVPVSVSAPAAVAPRQAAPVVPAGPAAPPPAESWRDERPIYDLTDLPYQVQSRLPELHVSVYAYSDNPESRLVRVNNRILREGSYLEEGLLLDEITPVGMIFAFEGYRFLVPKE